MSDNRTPSGNVKSSAYKKYGNQRGAFPIFDKRSALAALKLRGHAKSAEERASIVRRAARFAPEAAHQAAMADKDSK